MGSDTSDALPRARVSVRFAGAAVLAGCLALVGTSGSASAAPCPVDPAIESPSPALGAAEPEKRLSFVRGRIDRAARSSRIWALSWGLGLGALTVGQLALVPAVPRADRADFWVGAAASGIGALSRAVFIPAVLRQRRRLQRYDEEGTSTCDRLRSAERALVASAKWERQGRALWMHGLSLAYNAGVGLVLGLAFDRPVAGNRLAALGAVVGEVMIVTQPTMMLRTLRAYRSGDLTGPTRWRPAPLVLRGGGGVSIGAAI